MEGLAHADLAQQEAERAGDDGDQDQADQAPFNAAGQSADGAPGGLDQVDAQEVVVHADPAGVLGDEVRELAVDDVGDGDLLIAGAGLDLDAGALDELPGGLHHLQAGLLAAEVHEVDDGIPDDVVQGHQDGQGQEAPQAAAHGAEALLLIELLHLLLHLHLVVGVLLLDLLHLAGHPAHPHHALLGLHLEGQQDQLDDQGEQDQRHAVGPCQVVEQPQQGREGDTDRVSDG